MDPLGDLPSMEDEDLDIDMCGAPEELTATGLVVLMDVHALSDWSEHGTKTADDTCRACHRRPRLDPAESPGDSAQVLSAELVCSSTTPCVPAACLQCGVTMFHVAGCMEAFLRMYSRLSTTEPAHRQAAALVGGVCWKMWNLGLRLPGDPELNLWIDGTFKSFRKYGPGDAGSGTAMGSATAGEAFKLSVALVSVDGGDETKISWPVRRLYTRGLIALHDPPWWQHAKPGHANLVSVAPGKYTVRYWLQPGDTTQTWPTCIIACEMITGASQPSWAKPVAYTTPSTVRLDGGFLARVRHPVMGTCVITCRVKWATKVRVTKGKTPRPLHQCVVAMCLTSHR